MKNITSLALAGALGYAAANAAVTDPVGYVTETFKGSTFNTFGLTLHQPVVVSSDVDSVAGTVVTDADIDFDSTLTAGVTYVMEITSGTLAGAIQEVSVWSGSTFTTSQDLSAALAGGDTYKLRAASTIADIFGAANEAGLQTGSASTADVLWVPDGAGFQKYYYTLDAPPFVTEGWKNTGTGNADASNTPLIYTDGMLLERRGATDLDLTVEGSVKVSDTILLVAETYTYLSGVYPASSTLDSSGLSSDLLPGSVTTADVIWMPDGAGGFLKYYYALDSPPFVTEGWKRSDTGNTDQGSTEITSGFFIEKRTPGTFEATITAPAIPAP